MFGWIKYIFSIKQSCSIAVMIVFVLVFTVSWIFRRKNNKPSILSFYQKFAITTFFSSCALFFKINTDKNGLLARLVDSVFSFAKVFTFNQSVEETLKVMDDNGIKATNAMRIYIVIISAAILFCTAFAIVILISKILNDSVVQLKYYFRIGESYIFSEINENSACLANDIRKNHRLAQIIFAGVNKSELNKEQLDYLNSISGKKVNTTSRTITDFRLKEKNKTTVYLIDEEEKDNVKNGKTIFENNKKAKATINVFSTLRSAETIIDSIDKKGATATIDLVNPAQIIAYDTLWKHPMFESAERCGSDTMSVMVVGAGYIGMECAKAAMWCGVMDSFKFKINIVDKEDREKEFDAQYPDFRENAKKAGIPVDYNFYKADVTTSDFTEVLKKCSDANYIIVAIGDDEITMNTTLAIRKWFVRKAVNQLSQSKKKNNQEVLGSYTRIENGRVVETTVEASVPTDFDVAERYNPEKVPTIIPIIRNSDYDALIKDLEHNKKADNKTKETEEDKEYYTYSIGSNADIYKQNIIDEWIIEKISEKLGEEYDRVNNSKKKGAQSSSQTIIRSGRANAVHSFYKLRDSGIKITVDEKEKGKIKLIKQAAATSFTDSKKLKETLTKIEHDRWSVFQLLDGWVPVELDTIKELMDNKTVNTHKVAEGLMHGTIAPYEYLKTIGKKLYGKEDKFIKNDKALVDYALDKMIRDLGELDFVEITDNTNSQERN